MGDAVSGGVGVGCVRETVCGVGELESRVVARREATIEFSQPFKRLERE